MRIEMKLPAPPVTTTQPWSQGRDASTELVTVAPPSLQNEKKSIKARAAKAIDGDGCSSRFQDSGTGRREGDMITVADCPVNTTEAGVHDEQPRMDSNKRAALNKLTENTTTIVK
jgi:hypothetical protein